MMDLVAIEQIKQLKTRYLRGIDTCNLELRRSILAPDVKISVDSPTYQFELNGMDETIAFYRSSVTNRRFGMHHGHTPNIEVNGDDATGLGSFINLDKQTLLNGSAIYEDHDVKVQGKWPILRTGYKRLREMITPLGSESWITSQPIN